MVSPISTAESSSVRYGASGGDGRNWMIIIERSAVRMESGTLLNEMIIIISPRPSPLPPAWSVTPPRGPAPIHIPIPHVEFNIRVM